MKTGRGKRLKPEDLDDPSIADVDHDERLIRWMLGRTPTQRLEVLQNFVEGIVALQHAQKVT